MFKEQPKYVNPDLWQRFLIKKGYNGSIRKCGVKYIVTQHIWGTLILSEAVNIWKKD